MRQLGSSFILATLVIASGTCLAAEGPAAGKSYIVLEVGRFEVNRDDYSTKEAERAGRMTDEELTTLQRILIAEYTQTKLLPTVRKAGGAGEGAEVVLELDGKVVDWLAGNPAKRALVGWGAGQQKIEVDCVLKDKATGAILGQERVLDRKVGGWGGGSEDKGMRDFADKVAKFIHTTMDPRGWKAPAAAASPGPASGESQKP